VTSAAVAAYLVLCILLGGSAQGVWGMLALELLGIVLIAIAAILASSHFRDLPFAYINAVMATVLLKNVTLPHEICVSLPEREAIARGFD
jgi:hypothetical protein